MAVFEPGLSGVGSDHSANCATTTAICKKMFTRNYIIKSSVVNLTKDATIVIYDSRVVV